MVDYSFICIKQCCSKFPMILIFLGNFVYWSQLINKSMFLTFLKIHEKAKIHLEVDVDIIWVFRLVTFGADPHTVQEEIYRQLLTLS
jgi:hypothetical protein